MEFSYCLECGQIQGSWPASNQAIVNLKIEDIERRLEGWRRALQPPRHGNPPSADETAHIRGCIEELEEELERLLA